MPEAAYRAASGISSSSEKNHYQTGKHASTFEMTLWRTAAMASLASRNQEASQLSKRNVTMLSLSECLL